MDIGKIYRFNFGNTNGYFTFQLINKDTGLVLDCRGSNYIDGVLVEKGSKHNVGNLYMRQMTFLCDTIEEYNNTLPYKVVHVDKPREVIVNQIIYKDKLVEVPVDKIIYVDKPIMYYNETLIDKLYETYCKSKGRILNEYV